MTLFFGFSLTHQINIEYLFWVEIMVNVISVNHFQPKLISETENTSYFQPKFVEKLFSIGPATETSEAEDEDPIM